MTLALIDGDIITYRCGFTTEDVDEGLACVRTREVLDGILIDVSATSYRVFLTEENDPTAFRRKIYPEYKAHRTKPKPKWYTVIRDYMQVEYGAEVCREIEADDALGISQVDETSIICSIDKDLKQIVGHHYNFVKKEFDIITPHEGLRNFYTQLLTGDSSDNIKGIPKIGPVKAANILAGTETEQQMFNKVREAYGNDEEFLLNGRCLWIWKREHDDWQHYYQRLASCSDADLAYLKL